MATTPAPFFPTTAPAYAPTTIFPPPPFGFGPPTYDPYHYPFPYFTAQVPFPFTTPAFPYAAGPHQPNPVHLPYPQIHTPPPTVSSATQSSPPASAFFSYPVPMSGSSPVPACGYYTAPAAYTSPYSQVHAPPLESTAPPTPAPPITEASGSTPTSAQPWAASSPSPGLNPVRAFQPLAAETATTTPVRRPDQVPGASKVTQLAVSLGRTQKVTSAGAAASVACGSSASSTNTAGSTTTRTSSSRVFSAPSMSPSAATGYAAPHRFGEMPTTASAPSFSFTPSSGSKATASTTVPATATNASTVPSATAHAAPEVLGEMPKPISCEDTHGTADRTERSYFTLPADYPLEQATPPVSPSAAGNVGVTAQPSRAAQAAGLAPGLCSNDDVVAGSDMMLVHNLHVPLTVQDTPNVCKKMPVYDIYVEEDSARLNIISDVQDISLELQQQDDESAYNYPVLKASDPYFTRCGQISIVHSVRDLRQMWDPGEYTIYSSTRNKDIVGDFQTSIQTQEIANHLTECNSLKYLLQSAEARCPHVLSSFIQRYCSVKCNSWLNTVVQSVDQVEGLNPLSLTNYTWDPGVSKLKDTILAKCAVPYQVQFVQQGTEQSLFSLESSISPVKRVQWDLGIKISLQSRVNNLTVGSENEKPLSCTHNLDLAAWPNQSVSSGASYIWDPGTMLLQYKLLYTEEETNCHEDIKCYGVALWLIHFQPP